MCYEVRLAMINRLECDEDLGFMIPGGIWDRPIKAGQGQGATPGAFWTDPMDPTRLVRLRRTIYISEGGDLVGTSGPTNEDEDRIWQCFPLIYMYVDATNSGKIALGQIDGRIKMLLHGWQDTMTDGSTFTISALDRTETVESPDYPGTLICYRRYRAEYIERT